MPNTIKKISLLMIALLMMSVKGFSQDDHMKQEDRMKVKDHMTIKGDVSDEPSGITMTDGILYGKDYDPTMTVIEFSELMKDPVMNDGKIVLIRGNVSEVCQNMGCWMTMTDGGNTARVLTMHEFLLPKDIAGRNAVVLGKFKVTEITEDEARHYNEESKNPKNADEIKGPQKTFEIEASCIKILN